MRHDRALDAVTQKILNLMREEGLGLGEQAIVCSNLVKCLTARPGSDANAARIAKNILDADSQKFEWTDYMNAVGHVVYLFGACMRDAEARPGIEKSE